MMYLSRLKISLVVCCLTVVSLMKSYAQDFNYAIDNRKNIIYHTFSYQNLSTGSLSGFPHRVQIPSLSGYAREIKVYNLRTIFTITPALSIALKPNVSPKYSYGVGTGAKVIFGESHWKLSTGLSIGFGKQLDTDGYNSINFYSGANVSEGYYAKKWFSVAYISCNLLGMSKQRYSEEETATLKQTYPQAYQIQHLNNWIYSPISFSSGISIGYSFKERLDFVTSVGLLSFARGYKVAGGYSVYDNPHAGSYQLNVLSSYTVQSIILTVYYHFGRISEKPTK